MQILKMSGQTTVADIAAAAYNLKSGDSALATAEKNLIAANPSLAGNVSALPKNTVIFIPPFNGNPATGTAVASVDPIGSAFRARLQNISAAATSAATARSTPTAATASLGTAPGAVTTTTTLPALDFTVLQNDIAAFSKLFSG